MELEKILILSTVWEDIGCVPEIDLEKILVWIAELEWMRLIWKPRWTYEQDGLSLELVWLPMDGLRLVDDKKAI